MEFIKLLKKSCVVWCYALNYSVGCRFRFATQWKPHMWPTMSTENFASISSVVSKICGVFSFVVYAWKCVFSAHLGEVIGGGGLTPKCPGREMSWSPYRITSPRVAWFVPPWLTHIQYTQTDRQLLTAYTISQASWAKNTKIGGLKEPRDVRLQC